MMSALRLRGLVAAAATAVFVAVAAGPARGEALCPNEPLRAGFSAALPECRAYELVSPEARTLGLGSLIGTEGIYNAFDSWYGAPDGESVAFDVGGALPGLEGNTHGSRYVARRGAAGWSTEYFGASEAETRGSTFLGGFSPDLAYSFETVANKTNGLAPGNYVRGRDGQLEPIGIGTLGTAPDAEGYLVTSGGSHIVFGPPRYTGIGEPIARLEPTAPESVDVIYDRSVGARTTTVSLLPGGIRPTADARYLGTSADGEAVVFEINGVVYVHRAGQTKGVAYPDPGTQLTCAAPEEESLAWSRNGVAIAGADKDVYKLTDQDEGAAVQCEAQVGGALFVSSPPTPVPTGGTVPSLPALEKPLGEPTPADPQAGTEVSCPLGEWSGEPSLEYRWLANGKVISGATEVSYAVEAGVVPAEIQCEQLAKSPGGATVMAASEPIPTTPPPALSPSTRIVDIDGAESNPRSSAVSFAGASAGGGRIFYARPASNESVERVTGGFREFAAFDYDSDTTHVIAEGGKIWPVNVSEDGRYAYFVSTEALSGNTNSFGQHALAGAFNLYVWNGSSTSFIATVTAPDIQENRAGAGADPYQYGLGLWVTAQNGGGLAEDTSRVTPDGKVFVFQTAANLMPGFDSEGNSEIYRFDVRTNILECLSCDLAVGHSEHRSELETISPLISTGIGANQFSYMPNLSPDGETVFFETAEPLVSFDENSSYDVYRWSAGGLSLISSGKSPRGSFLYGISTSGRDVFFQTFQSLSPQDQDGGNMSIYDARVGGGFPPPIGSRSPCEGEACQGPLSSPPSARPQAPTAVLQGAGNVKGTEKHQKPKRHHKRKKHHKRGQHRKRSVKSGEGGTSDAGHRREDR